MGSRNSNGRDGKAILIGLIAILCIGIFTGSKYFFRDRGGNDRDPSTSKTAPESLPNSAVIIDPKDAWNQSENNDRAVFIDIRPASEFEQNHIPKSRPIAFDALSGYDISHDKMTIVVSSSSQESLLPQIDKILSEKNIPHAFLKGGFEEWVERNLPIISLGTPGSFVDQSKITYLTPEKLASFVNEHKDAIFLDIRNESEFRKSHAAGAINVPLSDIEFRSDELPRSKMIIIYGDNTTDAFRAGVRLADLNLYLVRVMDATPSDLEKSGVVFEKL